jgi:hypothetical protein
VLACSSDGFRSPLSSPRLSFSRRSLNLKTAAKSPAADVKPDPLLPPEGFDDGHGFIPEAAQPGFAATDPASGTILRLVLEAEPESGLSMERADIMVEYGSVSIGAKVYTCPLRSVSISTGRSPQLEMAMGLARLREVTRLDDVVFSGYHVFRSEMRILPD